MGGFSEDFEADLEDPMLKKDIQLSKEVLAFLEGNVEKCFLCKWMLEDYKKNGTFTGVKQIGEVQSCEIFPIRGEVNHLWLELYQKPYPFKKKVTKEESAPSGYAPKMPTGVFSTPGTSAPMILPSKPLAAPPPVEQTPEAPAPPAEITRNIDQTPIAKPRRF